MQVHKTVIKRARQNIKRQKRNNKLKKILRTAIKNFRKTTSRVEAQKQIIEITSLLHKFSQKRILPRNTAFRYQSRLTKRLNSLAA